MYNIYKAFVSFRAQTAGTVILYPPPFSQEGDFGKLYYEHY
jgi:hypothetical protein